MKHTIQYLILTLFLLTGQNVIAKDCDATLPLLTPQNVAMTPGPGNLTVSFTLDFSEIELGKNQQVIYTPVVVSGEGADSLVLAPVVLNGRNVSVLEKRHRNRKVAGAYASLERKNGKSQAVDFTQTVDYYPWMDMCSLNLAEDLCGCGDLQNRDYITLAYLDNRPVPEAIVVFVAPMAEDVKAREEHGSAFVDFKVNQTVILPDYRNNRAEIAKITSTIDLVKNDPNVSITEINIHGYASPEGSYSNNIRLAAGRAEALKNYVKSLYTLPEKIFTSESTPEDWEGLRRFVVGSNIENKEGILDLIDNYTLDPDVKDNLLKSRYPVQYRYMLAEWYPALRHSDYKVSYIVRPFTVEETKEILKINPRQVSLNEMFLVAQTYEPGSPEFVELMETAALLYPEDETANMNAAGAAIKSGDLDKASRYLSNARDSAEALNLQGVVEWKKGNLEAAKELFSKAASMGLTEAEGNLKSVELQQEKIYKSIH